MKNKFIIYLLRPLNTTFMFFGLMSLACIVIPDFGPAEKYIKGLPLFFLLQIIASYLTTRKPA